MNTSKDAYIESASSPKELLRILEQTRRDLSNSVCQKLEEHYGRKFTVGLVILDPGIERTKLVVHDGEKEHSPFFVTMTGETEFSETYVRTLYQNTLRTTIAESLPGIEVNAVLLDDNSPDDHTGLSLSSYIHKYNAHRALVRIIAEECSAPDQSVILKVVQSASQFYCLSIALNYWVLNREHFRCCQQTFLSLPSVSEAMISSYSPVSRFSAFVENGAIRMQEVI